MKNYWMYGKHTVLAALKNVNRKKELLLVTKECISFFKRNDINILSLSLNNFNIVNNSDISKLTKNNTHQGIALKVWPLEQIQIEFEKIKLILILDKINDPHNIGAMVRTALAFGVDCIVSTFDGMPSENATITKTACGAFELMPFIKVVNLAHFIKKIKELNYWIFGLDLSGQDNLKIFRKYICYEKIALVVGGEEAGIRPLILKSCDVLFKLPTTHMVNSINVSNACSIALWEHYAANQHKHIH